MDQLEGRTAVVTGAASGIGFALARALHRAGMNVALADVDEDALRSAAESLDRSGSGVTWRRTDVSDYSQMVELAAWVKGEFGPTHVVCNNAGVDGYRGGPLWQATEADWAWTMGVNYWGVVHGVRAFLPGMLSRAEPGHIVNTASAAALTKPNNMYGITKHAVLALTEALDAQLRAENSRIGVTALIPDLVSTPFFAKRHRHDIGAESADDLRYGAAERADKDALLREQGASPDVVAARALTAIRENQLYALTHESSKNYLRSRTEAILGSPG